MSQKSYLLTNYKKQKKKRRKIKSNKRKAKKKKKKNDVNKSETIYTIRLCIKQMEWEFFSIKYK